MKVISMVEFWDVVGRLFGRLKSAFRVSNPFPFPSLPLVTKKVVTGNSYINHIISRYQLPKALPVQPIDFITFPAFPSGVYPLRGYIPPILGMVWGLYAIGHRFFLKRSRTKFFRHTKIKILSSQVSFVGGVA
jgi:hypothetical protein